MKRRKEPTKRGPVPSPLKSQGMLVEKDQVITFTFGDGRSIRCMITDAAGTLGLECRSHPNSLVIWPNRADEIFLIPAKEA